MAIWNHYAGDAITNITEKTMLNKFPDNPNHEKNVRYLFSDDNDPNGQRYKWYFMAFPDRTDDDYFEYIDAKQCMCCRYTFTAENPCVCKEGRPVCWECYESISTIRDKEQLMRMHQFLERTEKDSIHPHPRKKL